MFRASLVIHIATIEVSIPMAGAKDTSASEVIEPLSACFELARPIFRPIYELETNIQSSQDPPTLLEPIPPPPSL